MRDPALPSWQGQKRTGRRGYKLMLYVAYEQWVIRVFGEAFTAPEWRKLSTAEREHVLAGFLELWPEDRPSRPWPLSQALLHAACAHKRSDKLPDTRETAALTIVASLTLPRLTPRSLKDLLRKLRPLARRFDN